MVKQISKSPGRGSFHVECELKQVNEGKKTMEQAQVMIDFYKSWETQRQELEATDEWKIDNLEYNLRSTDWILHKVRTVDHYAQNLYAALCNNSFIKNDVWPILADKQWSCSWRSAGGIIANMQEKGDYIDWYCSGIQGGLSDEEYNHLTKEQQEQYLYQKNNYVGEGYVTDEIKEDLLKLGWIVVDDESE